jgi:hypothetical protein
VAADDAAQPAMGAEGDGTAKARTRIRQSHDILLENTTYPDKARDRGKSRNFHASDQPFATPHAAAVPHGRRRALFRTRRTTANDRAGSAIQEAATTCRLIKL